MLSFIISVLVSLGVGVSGDIKLDEAQLLLKKENREVIVNEDGSYDIGWDKIEE